MSKLLGMAARLDAQRAADLAANDALMGVQPAALRGYLVQVKSGARVRLQFECMSRSSMDAATQHLDLCGESEYLNVRPLADRAVNGCVECVVCGGRSAPASTGLCTACRSLKATFASRYPDEVPA